MPVGPVTGETVFELLMSSDAANPQAHKTTCCPSDPPYDWLKPIITDVFNSCMQYFVATEFITEVSDWNVEVLWSTVVEIVLSRSKQCYVHYIYWFNNCSKYISVLKAFSPVEDYHNIHTYYFGTVLSWSRKYIFRRKNNPIVDTRSCRGWTGWRAPAPPRLSLKSDSAPPAPSFNSISSGFVHL